ncbi:MAG: hypothetical protein ABI721_05480 [Candidatus Dojkabacteria bacterium]
MSKTVDSEILTAKGISLLANPILVLFVTFVIGNFSRIRAEWEIFGIFILIGCFFPMLLYVHYLYIHRKSIWNYTAIPRAKRDNLFLTVIIPFCLNLMLFIYTGQSKFWVYTSMLMVIFFACFYLLNRFIDKASLHTGMFSFSILYLTNRVSVAFAILLVLIPFIAWSRVKLHKHTWFQLMLGMVVGMFLALLSWTF